jgi:NADH-ubiquinone oxidoreductase chain 5
LPAAIAAPTPVSSLVHSSTLVTAGVYLLIRFYNFLFLNQRLNYLLFIGIITTLISSLAAFFESDIKKIVALSTLSQLGIIIIRLGLNSYLLRFFHLVAHAFFKALLFISTGNIIHINNDYQDLRTTGRKEFSSLVRRKFVLIANFRLIGLPFIARFFRKENIIELIILFNNYFYVYILILIRVLRTAIYRTRFISYYFIRTYNKFVIT